MAPTSEKWTFRLGERQEGVLSMSTTSSSRVGREEKRGIPEVPHGFLRRGLNLLVTQKAVSPALWLAVSRSSPVRQEDFGWGSGWGLTRSESLALVKTPKPKLPESKAAAASLMRAPCSAAAGQSLQLHPPSVPPRRLGAAPCFLRASEGTRRERDGGWN